MSILLDILSEGDWTVIEAGLEQAGDSIVVTDGRPVIIYANAAACQTSGYSREELIGQNPHIFLSGRTDERELWETLERGLSWRGMLTCQHKDGGLHEEDTSLSPVRDAGGTVVGCLVIKSAATAKLVGEALAGVRTERSGVASLMRSCAVGATLEASAADFCDEVSRLEGIAGARLLLVGVDGEVVPLGRGDTPVLDWKPGVALELPAREAFLALCNGGPWWFDPQVSGGAGTPLGELAAAGLNAVLVVGLHWHGALVGALGVGGFAADGKSWAKERMVLVEELGAFAGQLLGPQIGKRLSAQQAYRAIQGVIDNQEFEAVLQPVTAVTSGKVMGYEALCQFADGTVPDVKFVQAAKVGLRAELEAAMAKAAVDAAQGLDETLWLSVNFSPATVLCGGAERAVAGAGRPIVIEVAEYEGISSYPALRRALARCGGTRVSVDDRGSGYACLNHIDALRPDYVKLDIGLVRGIDTDRVRQSLAAGVCHFADSAGITLIAAGVQTEAELSEVSRLGATLLQGRVGGALVR